MANTFTTPYNVKAAQKALKSDNIACQVTKSGAIYASNGFVMFKMNADEYDAIVRPIVGRDPGDWRLRNGELTDLGQFDAERVWTNAVNESENSTPVQHFRAAFETGTPGKNYTAFYSPDSGAVCVYNAAYIAAITDKNGTVCDARAAKSLSPLIIYIGTEPFAMIMPISLARTPDGANVENAVRAYFNAPEAPAASDADTAAEIDRLRGLLKEANERAEKFMNERDAAERRTATSPASHAPIAPAAPNAQTVAERFIHLDGVKIEIKGETTHAPVIWLTGDTEKHTDELKQAGAKWSRKRQAFYVCA